MTLSTNMIVFPISFKFPIKDIFTYLFVFVMRSVVIVESNVYALIYIASKFKCLSMKAALLKSLILENYYILELIEVIFC